MMIASIQSTQVQLTLPLAPRLWNHVVQNSLKKQNFTTWIYIQLILSAIMNLLNDIILMGKNVLIVVGAGSPTRHFLKSGAEVPCYFIHMANRRPSWVFLSLLLFILLSICTFLPFFHSSAHTHTHRPPLNVVCINQYTSSHAQLCE